MSLPSVYYVEKRYILLQYLLPFLRLLDHLKGMKNMPSGELRSTCHVGDEGTASISYHWLHRPARAPELANEGW